MCRYAEKNYKPHFACFQCRKAFKRRKKADIDPNGDDHPAICPQCGLLMADMGLDFSPPRHEKSKAWQTLAALFEVGETFHSCGCGGPGYRPRHPSALDAFFANRRSEYQGILDQYLESEPTTEKAAVHRAEAIKLWRARMERLEAARPGRRPARALFD